jgi:arylsulfatase A-like enzyme
MGKSRRSFLRGAGAVGVGAVAPGILTRGLTAAAATARPNLVFLLGEGVRWDESSLAGNAMLHTPNIDRIGREGVVFDNAFVINSLCLPSRATLLSGAYSHTTGAIDNQRSQIPASFPLVTDVIRDAGYEVAFIGKSHVYGALMDRYWDYYFGFEGQADYFHPELTEGMKGKFGPKKTYDAYVDDLLTDKALAWLAQPHGKPFCLFLWFYAPHAPFFRPLDMVDDFNGVPVPKPKSFDEYRSGYAGKPRGVAEALNKIGAQFLYRDAPRSLEELVKDHYAGVQSNDRNIGRVLAQLDAAGVTDDTAILWSSDHGFFLGEHRFYDKRLMYEPSIRVPLMLRYPRRIPAGAHAGAMALNLDIAPTLLDLAGAKAPKDFQGSSLVPLAQGKHVAWRKDWLYEYYEFPGYEEVRPCRGVRTERYKYIHYFTEPQEFELYDLQSDPDEMHNLRGDPAFAALEKQLAARLEELRRETGDHYVYKPTELTAPDSHSK